jgi:hypothetical protein
VTLDVAALAAREVLQPAAGLGERRAHRDPCRAAAAACAQPARWRRVCSWELARALVIVRVSVRSGTTMLTTRDLRELAGATDHVLVSLYVPTHRHGPDTQGDPIRLKNAMARALSLAADQGIDRGLVQARLLPAEALLRDTMFWQHQGLGLGLLLGPEGMREYRLAEPVEELVLVRDRFCIRPLLPAVSAGGRFYVLALSQNRVRLLQCSAEGARELDLRDIPHSLADAVGYDWQQKSLQFHTTGASGGGHAAVYHGHGAGTDDVKAEQERFLRLVDQGVVRLLGNGAPLVVAAVGYLAGSYRAISRYDNLCPDEVEGNPDRQSPQELRDRALPLVRGILDAARRQAVESVAAAAHSDRVVTHVTQVLAAARDGRVGTLLVRDSGAMWGRCDLERGTVEQHAQREPGDDDLLDLCVSRALATGAAVHAVPQAEIPGRMPLAAALRY